MDNNRPNREQRRAFYRLVYPPNKEPMLTFGGSSYSVMDISEAGIRFRNPFRHRMTDDLLTCYLLLHEGPPIKVIGRVARIVNDQVALHLLVGIPYKVIIAEQLYLKNPEK